MKSHHSPLWPHRCLLSALALTQGMALAACSGQAYDLGELAEDVPILTPTSVNSPPDPCHASTPHVDCSSPAEPQNHPGEPTAYPDTPVPQPGVVGSPQAPVPQPGLQPQSPSSQPVNGLTPQAPTSGDPAGPFSTRGRELPSFEQCEQARLERPQFEDVVVSGATEASFYGTWVGEGQVSSFGLPSGSTLVTLYVSETESWIRFGEQLEKLDLAESGASWSQWEGMQYTLRQDAVRADVQAATGVEYPLAVDFTAFPYEPYDSWCAERQPQPGMGVECNHTCLPTEHSDWVTLAEVSGDVCILDGTDFVSCSEVEVCSSACYCDDDACHFDESAQVELTAHYDGGSRLTVTIPWWWSRDNTVPTLGPDGEVWVQLSRQ